MLYVIIIGISLCIIIISIWFYRARIGRKQITYSYSQRTLFPPDFGNASGFELELNGQPVRGLFLVDLSFVNSGTVGVDRGDILIPLQVHWTGEARIFPVEVKEPSTESVTFKVVRDAHERPRMDFTVRRLEAGEAITCQVLYDSEGEVELEIEGRILGGNIVSEDRRTEYVERITRKRKYTFQKQILVLSILGLVYPVVGKVGSVVDSDPSNFLLIVVPGIVGLLLFLYVALRVGDWYVETRLARDERQVAEVEPRGYEENWVEDLVSHTEF